MKVLGWINRYVFAGRASTAEGADTNEIVVSDAGAVKVDAATTASDGSNVTMGAKADAAANDSTSSWSIVSLLKGVLAKLLGTLSVSLTGRNLMEGDTAHDAADTGNPLKIGGVANANAPAAVAEGDRVNASFDLQGRQRVTLQSGGTVGQATPTTANLMGATDGTNLQGLKVESGTNPNLRVGLWNGSSQVGTSTPSGDAITASSSLYVADFALAFDGGAWQRRRVANVYKYNYTAFAAPGTATVWTPAAGKKVRVMAVEISANAATQIRLRDGANGTDFLQVVFGGAGTYTVELGQGRLFVAANNVLELGVLSGAPNVGITVWGTEE